MHRPPRLASSYLVLIGNPLAADGSMFIARETEFDEQVSSGTQKVMAIAMSTAGSQSGTKNLL